MTNEPYIAFFEKQLDRANYWLAYAEAKNAAIIALNIAIVAAFISASFTYNLYRVAGSLLFIASVVSLISFWPFLASVIIPRRKNKLAENYIYFGDIALVDNKESYIDFIVDSYFSGRQINACDRKLVSDFASEIIYNSRLATGKFFFSRVALILDLIALLLVIVQFLVCA